jgi:hypothetical protein
MKNRGKKNNNRKIEKTIKTTKAGMFLSACVFFIILSGCATQKMDYSFKSLQTKEYTLPTAGKNYVLCDKCVKYTNITDHVYSKNSFRKNKKNSFFVRQEKPVSSSINQYSGAITPEKRVKSLKAKGTKTTRKRAERYNQKNQNKVITESKAKTHQIINRAKAENPSGDIANYFKPPFIKLKKGERQ